MNLGTILLHLNGGDRDTANLDYAIVLAAEHRAHLIALRTITPFYPTIGAFGDAAVGVIAELQERYRASERAASAKARQTAERLCGSADVRLEWREEEDFADDIAPIHTRYADFSIIGQPERGKIEPTHSPELPASVVMGAGRPVIVVPLCRQVRQSAAPRPGCLERYTRSNASRARRAANPQASIESFRAKHQSEGWQASAWIGHCRPSCAAWL